MTYRVPIDQIHVEEGTEVPREQIERYPLTWPLGWPRAHHRVRAPFSKVNRDPATSYRTRNRLTVNQGLWQVRDELRRLGVRDQSLIVSTNIRTRLDGFPVSGAAEPRDPGVAVYFKFKGKARVLACDKWNRVADNLAAIARHIEALRGQDRWGVGSLDQAFAGYTALPANTAANWRAVFGLGAAASWEQVSEAFRVQALVHHPDRGGSELAFKRLTEARAAAKRELLGQEE